MLDAIAITWFLSGMFGLYYSYDMRAVIVHTWQENYSLCVCSVIICGFLGPYIAFVAYHDRKELKQEIEDIKEGEI